METKHILTVLLMTLPLFMYDDLSACSIFSCSRGGKVLVGNNEDWKYSTDAEVWFVPASKKHYGRILFGWKQFGIFRQAQGGMNDRGLVLDWAMCPQDEPPPFSLKKKIATFSFSDDLLAECATVDEAVSWLMRYHIFGIRSHILLTDRSGASLVVEWVDGNVNVIRKKDDFQIITNFWLSQPKLGGYPCQRYEEIVRTLEGNKPISVEAFLLLLKRVSLSEKWPNGEEAGTIYTNVYDPIHLQVTLCFRGDTSRVIRLNLLEELRKGPHAYKIGTLFRKDRQDINK